MTETRDERRTSRKSSLERLHHNTRLACQQHPSAQRLGPGRPVQQGLQACSGATTRQWLACLAAGRGTGHGSAEPN